ncbi:MAG: response regulator transcription factor [Bacteroidales bacterium]|nr:response regulator transcription factor [Bacteroidales bacterium]
MKLLIIEDEKELSNSIANFLSQEDYLCEQAYTYEEAMIKVQVYEYECILVDLMLPGGNGLDILRELKKKNSNTGVIIISAKDSVDDKVLGLKIGADDYLAKPFYLSELSMRIYALMRRKNFSNNNLLQSNEMTIDLLSKEVKIFDRTLELTKTEYELLLFLIENKKRIVSKNAIAEHLTGDMADMMSDHNFVYAHIKNLKAKLAEAGYKDCIKTFYGTGYKWTE